MKYQKAFTLVEVLVATVIFSLLMLLVSFSLKQGLFIWGKQEGNYETAMEQQKLIFRLTDALEQIYPYKEKVQTNQGIESQLYFYGEPNRMQAVTAHGVFFSELSLINIQCVQQENNTFALILNEQNEWTAETREQVIQNDLKSCQLSYFVNEKDNNNQAPIKQSKKVWRTRFSSGDKGYLPYQVKLSWEKYNAERGYSLILQVVQNDKFRQSLMRGADAF